MNIIHINSLQLKFFVSILFGLFMYFGCCELDNDNITSRNNASDTFEDKLTSICWVAYAPTNFNPIQGIFPDIDSVREDLKVLNR